MKNIRLYELESEYKKEHSSLEFPTVSYTKDTSKVWYITKPNILRAWFLIEEENLIEGPDGTEGYFTYLYGFDPTFTGGPATPFNAPYIYDGITYNGIESLFKIVIDDQEIIEGDNLVTLKNLPVYKWETLGRHKVDYYFTNDCNDLHSIFGIVSTTDLNSSRRLLPIIHVNFDGFDTKNLECLYNSFSIIGQDLWLSVERTEDGEISWDVITDSLDGTVITKPRYAKALFNLCNKNFDKLKVNTKCFPNGYAIIYVDYPYHTTFRYSTPDIIIYENLPSSQEASVKPTLPYSKVYSYFQNHQISVLNVGTGILYEYSIPNREVLLRVFNNIDLIEQEMVRLPLEITELFNNECYRTSDGYKTCSYKGIYNFLANEGSSWVNKLNSEFGYSLYVTNGDGYIELGFEEGYIRVNPNDEVEVSEDTCQEAN